LINFWRKFEIEFKEEEIRLRTYLQLEFIKEIIKLENTFIRMVDKVIIDLPGVERHLEGVIQVFLQFDKELMPIYGYIDIKKNQRPLMVLEREWIFE
jgi:hypothetical protein